MVRRNSLRPADQQLWAAYAQTLSRLLPGRTILAQPEPPPAAPPAPPAVPAPPSRSRRPAPLPDITPLAPPPGLDKSTWARFSAAKLRAAQTLDLHGLTATRAHHATASFIERAHLDGVRCVEIITGQGEILVRELPMWLNAPSLRPLILAIAHPPLNRGSFRVLLKRRR
jgi:DNA-nicking Smr family endonuclease